MDTIIIQTISAKVTLLNYSDILSNSFVGFRNHLNQRIQRSHPDIWSFIKCLQGEEARFKHMSLQINASVKSQSKKASTSAIQQRTNTLNERYINNKIDLRELLDGLSVTVTKQSKYILPLLCYIFLIFFLSLVSLYVRFLKFFLFNISIKLFTIE